MSPGLLQLAAVRSDRQTHAASTVGAECCGKADHRSEKSRITSHRYFVNFIDCRSDELNLRLPAWYTKCGQAKYLAILADDIHLDRHRKFCSLPQVLFGEKVLCHSCSVVLVTYVFAAAGPRIWNNLPASLRDKEVSCTEFRRKL